MVSEASEAVQEMVQMNDHAKWFSPFPEHRGLAVLVDAIDQLNGCQSEASLLELLNRKGQEWRVTMSAKEFDVFRVHAEARGKRLRLEAAR